MLSDDDYDFEYEPEASNGKEVIVFFGQKGSGKTSAAYMLEGKKTVLSFDGKSLRVKELMRPDDPNIEVLDARKYLKHFKPNLTESAKKTFDYIIFLLDHIKTHGGTDWVVIDGLEIALEICEMKMRYDHKVGPFDGFSNLGFWKDRKLNVRAIHDAALAAASKGVVYTTYIDKDEIVNNSTLVKKNDVPKWMDIIMYETDAVIKTEVEKGRFLLKVVSSKIKRFKTGDVLDVTDTLELEDSRVLGEKTEEVNLSMAMKRKKARFGLEKCPQCNEDTVNEMGVIHCTKCDWVHEDEPD